MAEFNYIKIAVHGQFDGVPKTVYTYPPAGDGTTAEWDKVLFDPSSIVKNFLNARECYVIWGNPLGHYFSLITRNPLDPRSGHIMITLMVADGYSLSGRQIINALVALKKTLVEDGDRFDGAVDRCLEAVGIPATGVKLESWKHVPSSNVLPTKGMCYRTYVSGQELETIMSFPAQPDYERYTRVIVISATASLRPNVHIDRITSPVKKIFTVITPEGVSASKSVVTEGERLSLTYSKPGFNSRKETIIAGIPSPYVRYDGAAIRVKTAAESGMGFVRRVRLVVKSAKGGMVNGYTINVNGHPVNTMEPYIELNEHELAPGSKTEINVASNNYRPLKVVKDSSSLATMETLELVLVPMEQGIILRLDFGEGRVFEQEISIEKNTPEYSQLHSGYFHGFRAHRLTTPTDGEVYNVDVKASSKPTAPQFTNVAATNRPSANRTTAPVFENITKGKGEEGKKPENKNYDEDKVVKSWSGNKMGILMGAVLAIVLIILAFVFILPGHESASTDNTDSIQSATSILQQHKQNEAAQAAGTSSSSSSTAAAPVSTNATANADEKADVEYLNANNSWELSKIKSPKYKALFNAIKEGNIKEVVNNDYFAVMGTATNTEAVKSADFMWKAVGTPNEGSNKNAMKASVKGDRINIHQLYEDLARRRPAAPNTSARPSR